MTTPWDHAEMDEHRKLGYKLIKILNVGVN